MKNKKLVIISHTEHYVEKDGVIKGWGSTINEINYLANYWEEVEHVACLYDTVVPKSALAYTQSNVKFSPIPPFGGQTIKSKLLILTKIPQIVRQVNKSIKGATEVQLRLPTSIGLFLLPLFAFFWSRNFVFWVKYAGNWNPQKAPLSYKLQKWFLVRNFAKCKVTINGFWPNQLKHCYSFENPCLTNEDIVNGLQVSLTKQYVAPFVFCFVGRLDEAKGMHHIVKALKEIPSEYIKEVHFVGDSAERSLYEKQLSFLKERVFFHGFLTKKGVHDVFKKAHFLLLPSASEGFPKVIAEAACYGVIPVVSNVGSIPHYINATNGFVCDLDAQVYSNTVLNLLKSSSANLKEKANELIPFAKKFTFTNYLHKLKLEIFNS